MRRVVSASSRRSARISIVQLGRLRLGRFELGDLLLEPIDRLFEGQAVGCAGHVCVV